MTQKPVVYVVDDDAAMRESLTWLLDSVGLDARAFDSAGAFLEAFDDHRQGCLLLDVRMPGMSGLDLQERLRSMDCDMPVLVITGYGDVAMAVRAMKAGAVDFIEKPFNDQELLDRVQQAVEQDGRRRSQQERQVDARRRLGRLTPREREVMHLVVTGRTNKQIAEEFGLSDRTVEVHRANIMAKTEAESLADLVRQAMLAEQNPEEPTGT